MVVGNFTDEALTHLYVALNKSWVINITHHYFHLQTTFGPGNGRILVVSELFQTLTCKTLNKFEKVNTIQPLLCFSHIHKKFQLTES